MFTAYEDRIEVVSLGTLPPGQTKDGFFSGVSIPVNKKLCEILLQLHISEKSGRGVPRIVKAYGQEVFEFKDNAIVVTIPFNRLDLGTDTQATTQVTTQVTTHVGDKEGLIFERIISFCDVPRSTKEITEHLGFKERKSATRYIRKLLDQGRIAMTNPDNPKSSNQKYITVNDFMKWHSVAQLDCLRFDHVSVIQNGKHAILISTSCLPLPHASLIIQPDCYSSGFS